MLTLVANQYVFLPFFLRPCNDKRFGSGSLLSMLEDDDGALDDYVDEDVEVNSSMRNIQHWLSDKQ